jgi:hypothetical protein
VAPTEVAEAAAGALAGLLGRGRLADLLLAVDPSLA